MNKQTQKYAFLALLILVVIFAIFLLKPFLVPILASALLAYIFHPIYEWVNKRLKRPNISAAIVSILVIIILAIPTTIALTAIVQQGQTFYDVAKESILTQDFTTECQAFLCKAVQNIWSNTQLRTQLQNGLETFTTWLVTSVSTFAFTELPKIVLNIFVTFFVLFYLLREGPEFVSKLANLIALRDHHRHKIITRLNEVTHAIVYGSLIIALAQGFLAAIGYWLFGISSSLFWGLITAFFALVPIFGTAIIWVPAGIILIIQGIVNGQASLIAKGAGLLVYGALLISSLDNILKPKVIGKKSSIHPVIILLGVLGGIAILGFIGAFIGPLILALALTLIEIYKQDF